MGLALGAGKLTANAGRLLRVGGGTSLPGLVARRIDPTSVDGEDFAWRMTALEATPW